MFDKPPEDCLACKTSLQLMKKLGYDTHELTLIRNSVGELGATDCSTPLFIRVRNIIECVEQLGDRLEKIETAVRLHRDTRGDDRCWRDDETLYKVLPEGYEPPERDTAVELDACRRFIASRQNPETIYVSPQRHIEELESIIKSIATMLGWGNVPPLETLERSITALKAQAVK